tara:strand:- start:1756 stop:1974 length:219 start_codon:yes stop_codon:yes gene_type:complete
MYKYKPNDIIKLKDGNVCKIVRIADWNEYGCDFHFFEKNYVIDFIEKKKPLSASYQIYRNGKYNYVMTENDF